MIGTTLLAERDLLAASLSEGKVLSEIAWLQTSAFQNADHQELFSAIKGLPSVPGPIPLSLIEDRIKNHSNRRGLMALAAELSVYDVLPVQAPRLARIIAENAHNMLASQAALVLSQDPANPAARIRLLDLLVKGIDEQHVRTALPTLRSGRDLRALDIRIDWLIEGIIPKHAVTLLYGRGGIGKTTLSMMIAAAVDSGNPFFGMPTTQTPVIVIDYENSLAVLSERAKKTLVDGVLFWDSSHNPPPLDKPGWIMYKELLKKYPGSLFIFDTLRSAHSGDENDSETMSLIMSRLRELRDAGATILVLHHTPKGNDRQFKGSGAILDLCDHTLALYQAAQPGSDQESDNEDASDKVYRFGTGKKTRYRPHRTFLRFDPDLELFLPDEDPESAAMERLRQTIAALHDSTTCANQSEVVAAAEKDKYDFGGQRKIRALLHKGEGLYWTVSPGPKNAKFYAPLLFGSLAPPIEGEILPSRDGRPFQVVSDQEMQPGNGTA